MIGTTVDQYKILSRIGGGGMGEVYRALDLELQRDVAIKCVRPELADLEEVTRRFRNEARTLAKLSHLNIATVYRFFAVDERLFLVMEYIDGAPLSGKPAGGGRLPYQQAISMIRDALHGLGYAHENGVVHRDIKPGNLMLDQRGIVKVLDFGIAHLIGGTRLTRAGSMVGTPAYMAPEQILGKQVDQRTDLYSLGIVLYELLSGQLPYQGDSEFELMRSHLEKSPPHLRDIANLDIPLKLQQSVERALGKEKEERFQSANEFDAALADVIESEGKKDGEHRAHTTVLPGPTPGMADLIRPVATEIKRRIRPQQIAIGAGVAAVMLVAVWAIFAPSVPEPVQSPMSSVPMNPQTGMLPPAGSGTNGMGVLQPQGGVATYDPTIADPSAQAPAPLELADGTVLNQPSAPASSLLPSGPSGPSEPAQASSPSPTTQTVPRQAPSLPQITRVEPARSQPPRVQTPPPQSPPEVRQTVTASTPVSQDMPKITPVKVSYHERQGKGRFSRDVAYNGAFTLAVSPGGNLNLSVQEIAEVRRDGVMVKREVVNTQTRTPGTFKSKHRIPGMKNLEVGAYDVQLLFVAEGRTLGSYKWRVDVVD